MFVLAIDKENQKYRTKIGKDENLKIKYTNNIKNALNMVKNNPFDLVVIDYQLIRFRDPETLEIIKKIVKNTPCLLLPEQQYEQKKEFLEEIVQHPEIFQRIKTQNEKFLTEKAELLSDKNSIESAFTEVWKIGDCVLKIREDNFEKAEMRIEYQLELRKSLDFLPEYYGTLLCERNDQEIVANFYEYVRPLQISKISISDMKKILEIIEQAYEHNYYGIDLKVSNFGKKNGKILYLDEKGIGGYVPPDWIELLTTKLGKKFETVINDMKKH